MYNLYVNTVSSLVKLYHPQEYWLQLKFLNPPSISMRLITPSLVIRCAHVHTCLEVCVLI